jgi:hypothetical protein
MPELLLVLGIIFLLIQIISSIVGTIEFMGGGINRKQYIKVLTPFATTITFIDEFIKSFCKRWREDVEKEKKKAN